MKRDGARASVETRRWTRREYGRMIDAGILHEDEPIELIEGRLIVVIPMIHKRRHAWGEGGGH